MEDYEYSEKCCKARIFSPLLQNKTVVTNLVLVTEMHREQVKDVLLLTPECMHNVTAAAFIDTKL